MATTQIKNGYAGGSDAQLLVNSDGSINTSFSSSPTSPLYVYQGAFNAPTNSDAIAATYPSSTQEVYKFYTGGLAGTLLMTLTVNYTDATKAVLLNVVKT
jgi:hypothetical protein